jgi:hypothetical protein
MLLLVLAAAQDTVVQDSSQTIFLCSSHNVSNSEHEQQFDKHIFSDDLTQSSY